MAANVKKPKRPIAPRQRMLTKLGESYLTRADAKIMGCRIASDDEIRAQFDLSGAAKSPIQ